MSVEGWCGTGSGIKSGIIHRFGKTPGISDAANLKRLLIFSLCASFHFFDSPRFAQASRFTFAASSFTCHRGALAKSHSGSRSSRQRSSAVLRTHRYLVSFRARWKKNRKLCSPFRVAKPFLRPLFGANISSRKRARRAVQNQWTGEQSFKIANFSYCDGQIMLRRIIFYLEKFTKREIWRF